jgi:hypothetical protein
MGGKSRNRIYGDKVRAAKVRLTSAQELIAAAEREAIAARCELWSAQMQGYGGPAQPSPMIEEAVGCGFFFLIVKCKRCNHQGPVDLRLLRRARRTDIWRLEERGSLGETQIHLSKLPTG